MLTPGASNTCSARLLASLPITLPNSLATAGSKDAARAMAEGRAVALAEDGSEYTETSTRSPPIMTKTGGGVVGKKKVLPIPPGAVGVRRGGKDHSGNAVT